MKARRTWVLVVAVLAAASWPMDGEAYTIAEEDEFSLQVSGGIRGTGRLVTQPVGDSALAGRYDVSFARLKVGANWEDRGRYFMQLGAESGTAQLLDARVTLVPLEGVDVQLGQFKMPVSAEYMTSAADLLFSRRAALNSVVARRALGSQVVVTPLRTDDLTVEFNGGLFTPGTPPGVEPRVGAAVGRVHMEVAERFGIHAAYLEHVLGDNLNPATEERIHPNNGQLDLAFRFDDGPWRALIETLYIFDGPDGAQFFGVHLNGAHRFRSGDMEFEPALAYDYLDRDGQGLHRATAGLNVYWVDGMVRAGGDFAMERGDLIGRQVVSGSLQVRF